MSGNEVGVDGAFDSAASDDWGAFESVLTQLEQEEKASEAQEADTGAEIDEKSMTVILGACSAWWRK
ncbi:hypothetical protein AT251_24190 [Enterovibrio nigricans]|nr:hypothetical protein [Enterovibrio nigricans]PKF48701.1 hypothetical protein AT251_24190 [Enterovibrio nigricans]